MSVVWHFLANLTDFYIFVLIGRLIFEYVQMFSRNWRPRGGVLVVTEVIYTVTDPLVKTMRRIIPPIRLGSIYLDLSFLVLIIGLQIIGGILHSL